MTSAGTKLGRYEIRSKIGEGGMVKFIWLLIWNSAEGKIAGQNP
jgi:hypothetical protein